MDNVRIPFFFPPFSSLASFNLPPGNSHAHARDHVVTPRGLDSLFRKKETKKRGHRFAFFSNDIFLEDKSSSVVLVSTFPPRGRIQKQDLHFKHTEISRLN